MVFFIVSKRELVCTERRMNVFKVRINTDAYISAPCSKKNWEPGTYNDFMRAINGWETIENDEIALMWRIKMFDGSGGDWSNPEWLAWKDLPTNHFHFRDILCNCNRVHDISPYGYKQGYFNYESVIREVKNKGKARIPFSWAYDSRQMLKGRNLSRCYMEIVML